jgi:hypothetical protein
MCCNNKSIRYAAFLQILQTPLSVIAPMAEGSPQKAYDGLMAMIEKVWAVKVA